MLSVDAWDLKIKRETNWFNKFDSSSLNTLITSLLIVSSLTLRGCPRMPTTSLSRNVARDGMPATVSHLLVLDSARLKFNPFDYAVHYMIYKFQSLSHRKHIACHTQPPVNAVYCVKRRICNKNQSLWISKHVVIMVTTDAETVNQLSRNGISTTGEHSYMLTLQAPAVRFRIWPSGNCCQRVMHFRVFINFGIYLSTWSTVRP